MLVLGETHYPASDMVYSNVMKYNIARDLNQTHNISNDQHYLHRYMYIYLPSDHGQTSVVRD